MFLGCQVTQIFNNPSYISTKAPGLMGYSERKNGNCNITIDIIEFEEPSLELGLWRTTKIDEKKT